MAGVSSMLFQPARKRVLHAFATLSRSQGVTFMTLRRVSALVVLLSFCAFMCVAQTNNPNDPTWWDKYNYIRKTGATSFTAATTASSRSSNVDVSNECGPQSETYIAIDS